MSDLTRAEKAQIARELRDEGIAIKHIAEGFGVNRRTVSDWLNDPTGERKHVWLNDPTGERKHVRDEEWSS